MPTVRLASSPIAVASTSTRRSPYEPGRPHRWSRQAVLPRRFRSSALRASGAGRLATDRSGRPVRRAKFGIGSCPQFVVMAAVAPSSLGVAVNTQSPQANTRQLITRRYQCHTRTSPTLPITRS
jgi:hypothetical protein